MFGTLTAARRAVSLVESRHWRREPDVRTCVPVRLGVGCSTRSATKMSHTVFFAWQLDTPGGQNKQFIWNALGEAVKSASSSASLEASPRPETDTQGISGSPNIVQTIFRRIRDCSVFVADLSFVATTESGKKVPNPNVLIELGFAAKAIGWERTIFSGE